MQEALCAKEKWAILSAEQQDKFYELKEELADRISAQGGKFQEFLEDIKKISANLWWYEYDNSKTMEMLDKEDKNMLQNSIDKLETKITLMHTQLVEKIKSFEERMRKTLEKLPEVERNCDNVAVSFESAVKDLVAFNNAYK
ncbi:unnamed protein product, partial [Gongylonema pulchrum]|uniref:DUF148 domain-containing protein n=1 Tax=Gongylonema pulchrum TaxID=637853 RepID=A0A183DKY2_9BILA